MAAPRRPSPELTHAAPDPFQLATDAPPGSRRRLVLLMAAFTTAVEIASIAGAVPDIPFGSLDLPLSIVPALGLAVACGERLLGRSTRRRVAVGYWIVVAIAMPIVAVLYIQDGRLPLFTSLVVASASEELVYRLAIPAVIAMVLRFGNVRPDYARIAGLVLAGVWFVLLPGHREQMHTLAGPIPFLAFATLAGLLVYRSGSILPMAAGHALINLLTVLMWNESVAADARGMSLACILGLLVLAYGRPRRITVADGGESLVDTRTGLAVTSIDLRDGKPASVTLADGTTLEVAEEAAQPIQVPRYVID